MAVAGAAGHVELAFSLLDDMGSDDLRPARVRLYHSSIRPPPCLPPAIAASGLRQVYTCVKAGV